MKKTYFEVFLEEKKHADQKWELSYKAFQDGTITGKDLAKIMNLVDTIDYQIITTKLLTNEEKDKIFSHEKEEIFEKTEI